MILLAGIPSEAPLARVLAEVERLGFPHVILNQREFDRVNLDMEILGGSVGGELSVGGRCYPLEEIRAVYTRLMDDRLLPELDGEAPDSLKRMRCRTLHELLSAWLETTPARVVNRMGAMGSNFSKPYQAQLIQQNGFGVPDTLVTNDPDLVRTYRRHHGRVVYKSVSSVRSIVQELADNDMDRIDRIRWCPTMFQRYLEGVDIRVHVVGDMTIATRVETRATDYRYAHHEGEDTGLTGIELDDEISARCVGLARDLGLEFAGVDLRIDPEGVVYCFEVNPSPAFSYYEAHTGQPIAETVARYLADA